MKSKIISGKLVLALLAITLISSCSKNKTETPAPVSIIGDWEGAYGLGQGSQNYFYAFRIHENGTIEEIGSNAAVEGTGTWELSGTVFTARYSTVGSNVEFFIEGVFDDVNGTLQGNWGYDQAVDNGSWFMRPKVGVL